MSNTIKDGDIVTDVLYKETFTFSKGDRFIIDRLRPATEEEKRKLQNSGASSISVGMDKEEIKKLDWLQNERFALADIEKKEMFLTSDKEDICQDVFKKMTPNHPMYSKLQLVERPIN